MNNHSIIHYAIVSAFIIALNTSACNEKATHEDIINLRNHIESTKNDINKSKETRIKFVSGIISNLDEPFKSYVKRVDYQLQELLNKSVKEIFGYNFEAHIHLRINQNGTVTVANVLKTTLKSKDKSYLQEILLKSGPYDEFPEEIVKRKYVTIALTRVVKFTR